MGVDNIETNIDWDQVKSNLPFIHQSMVDITYIVNRFIFIHYIKMTKCLIMINYKQKLTCFN